jgi:protein-S-isoprenylcysteine O-methyltransferase Ste14
MIKRLSAFLFGIAAYIAFLYTFLYGIGFVGNIIVSKGIDGGGQTPFLSALAVDLALIVIFGVQHSLMSRPAFKKRWTCLVPEQIERSIFVLSASFCLQLLFREWRPMPVLVWHVPAGPLSAALTGLFWAGWLIALASSFLINHFDLFGLRQVYLYLRGIDYIPVAFRHPAFYRYVRHPLMLGFLIAFWATAHMSAGHLIFSLGMTAYIFIGIALEERDLLNKFGEEYEHYRRQVPMIIPLPRKK